MIEAMGKHRWWFPITILLITATALLACNPATQFIPGIEHLTIPNSLYTLYAKLSPDGTQLMMTGSKKGDPTYPTYIYSYNLESKEIVKIPIADNFRTADFAWSPDGTELAIAGAPEGELDRAGIWLLNLNDYSVERITGGETMAWSPEGNRIAIIEKITSTRSRIKIWDFQNHIDQTIFEFDHAINPDPKLDWSPSGKYLMISVPDTNTGGYAWGRLYRLNIDGSSFFPFLQNSTWSLSDPTSLPNSKWIAFIMGTGEGATIAVAPESGECFFPWLSMVREPIMLDVSKDDKKVLVVTMFDLYIVDLEKAVPANMFPDQLRCP
jgi:Tol biopolymer transport system component